MLTHGEPLHGETHNARGAYDVGPRSVHTDSTDSTDHALAILFESHGKIGEAKQHLKTPSFHEDYSKQASSNHGKQTARCACCRASLTFPRPSLPFELCLPDHSLYSVACLMRLPERTVCAGREGGRCAAGGGGASRANREGVAGASPSRARRERAVADSTKWCTCPDHLRGALPGRLIN